MAISVRELPSKDGDHGTLLRPTLIHIEMGQTLELRTMLGYEAIPSSDFYQFTVDRRCNIQVIRQSDDIYAVHVAVALIDSRGKRICSLVASQSGIGEFHEIEPGTYKIVASLGMPVEVRDLRLQVTLLPSYVGMRCISSSGLRASARKLRGMKAVMNEGAWSETKEPHGGMFLRGISVSDQYMEGEITPASRAQPQWAVPLGPGAGSAGVHAYQNCQGVSWMELVRGVAHMKRSMGAMVVLYGHGFARMAPPMTARALMVEASGSEAHPGAKLRALMVEASGSEAMLDGSSGLWTGGRLRGISATDVGGTLRLVGTLQRLRGLTVEDSPAAGWINRSVGLQPAALDLHKPNAPMPPLHYKVRGDSITVFSATARMTQADARRPGAGYADSVACSFPAKPDAQEPYEKPPALKADDCSVP